jgi:general secretion pathway protein K
MVKPNDSQINNKLPKQSQSGVALLTILIMVVLATILAVSILRYQNANLEETKLLLRQDQALQYAWSAEYFFSELLIQDAKDNSTDSLNENWAQPFPPFPVEDGVVTGQLQDAQGRFNLNSLLNENGEKNETAVLFFQAMLERLNLDPNLVEAVIDWQDADNETVGAMGAENSYYQGVQAGYLAPNQMFSSAKQLQWVRGFEGESYQRIAPYISALPSRSTKININTAADPRSKAKFLVFFTVDNTGTTVSKSGSYCLVTGPDTRHNAYARHNHSSHISPPESEPANKPTRRSFPV